MVPAPEILSWFQIRTTAKTQRLPPDDCLALAAVYVPPHPGLPMHQGRRLQFRTGPRRAPLQPVGAPAAAAQPLGRRRLQHRCLTHRLAAEDPPWPFLQETWEVPLFAAASTTQTGSTRIPILAAALPMGGSRTIAAAAGFLEVLWRQPGSLASVEVLSLVQ